MSPELLDTFLAEPHVGVLATVRQSGLPYTVPVWWLWHEDAFWLTGTDTRIWCQQLLQDPRCSLCVEALTPAPGHIGCDGRAEAFQRPDFDIWPISRMLVDKYVPEAGRDAFFANMQTEPRLLFRLEPESRKNALRAIDMSVYRGKKADREFQQSDQPST